MKLPKIRARAESDQQILLTWKGTAGAKEYWVYRASKMNGKYQKVGKAKETSYRDQKAKLGKTYYYKVQAIGKEARYDGEAGMPIKAKACLKTPSNVKVSISGKDYKVRWSKSKGAKSIRSTVLPERMEATGGLEQPSSLHLRTRGPARERNGTIE